MWTYSQIGLGKYCSQQMRTNNVDESVIEGSAEEIAGTELDGEPDDLGRSQPQPQPSAADSLEPTEEPLPDA